MINDNATTIPEDWFAHAFGELYPIIYAHRTVEAARPEAEFAAAQIALRPEDKVLDLCCGNGRHMAHLIAQGATVTGLDYSPTLLSLARQQLGPGIPLVRGDMRALPFTNAFDVLVNFFTSFGYFLQPEDNAKVVHDAANALKPGGRFFIDYLNAACVEKTLVPESVRHSQGYEIRENRWIDTGLRRVNKNMVVLRDGVTVHESGESVRLYDPDEFCTVLEAGGLRVEKRFGDYTGAPLNNSLPRMIVVGHRAD